MHSPFEITIRNHSYTIRTGRSKIVATRSTIDGDLKPLSGISKSQTWEFVFKQIQDRRVRGVSATHGHVSKFYNK